MQAFVYAVAEWAGAKHAVNQVVVWSSIVRSKKAARISLQGVQMAYPYALTELGKRRPALSARAGKLRLLCI